MCASDDEQIGEGIHGRGLQTFRVQAQSGDPLCLALRVTRPQRVEELPLQQRDALGAAAAVTQRVLDLDPPVLVPSRKKTCTALPMERLSGS